MMMTCEGCKHWSQVFAHVNLEQVVVAACLDPWSHHHLDFVWRRCSRYEAGPAIDDPARAPVKVPPDAAQAQQEPHQVVMRLHSLHMNGFELEMPDPSYLFTCDINGGLSPFLPKVLITSDKARARRFRSASDALELWKSQSRIQPLRPDGKPNRPMTAYTITIEPAS